MNREQNERFQRWQQKTIEQFTQVINILLLISSGFLWYLVSLKVDSNLKTPIALINLLIILTTIILVILVFLSYNRLKDFRLTTSKIKSNEVSSEKIREIGNKSWTFLNLSLLLFSADIIVFVIAIMWT